MLATWWQERETARRQAADYRAAVIWQAVVNGNGGVIEHEGAEPRAVDFWERFPSLGEFGERAEGRDDSAGLIAALRRMGAVDKRGG